MDLISAIQAYLVIHGVSTVGIVVVFLIRNEHRLTKLEVSHDNLKTSHDVLTGHGTVSHGTQP